LLLVACPVSSLLDPPTPQLYTPPLHDALPISCLLVLARPYHMDPGIGHEIEGDLQAYGYPVLWTQYFPTDPDLLEWGSTGSTARSEEHTSELQSHLNLVCRLLLEKKK